MNVYISDHDPTVKPGARAPVCCTQGRPIQPWPRWAPATGLRQTERAGPMVLKWYLLLLVTAVPDSALWCSYRLTSRAEWRWWLWAQIRIALLHRRYTLPNPGPKPLPCHPLQTEGEKYKINNKKKKTMGREARRKIREVCVRQKCIQRETSSVLVCCEESDWRFKRESGKVRAFWVTLSYSEHLLSSISLHTSPFILILQFCPIFQKTILQLNSFHG